MCLSVVAQWESVPECLGSVRGIACVISMEWTGSCFIEDQVSRE